MNTLAPPATRATLLIVDDQAINLKILQHIFRDDYEVHTASSGEQTLAQCAQLRPDLILLDVLMPDMDGHEVLRRLKANPTTQDIPVIFVTAQNDPNEESQGLQLGAVDFITKPVNATVVRARVHAHLLLRDTLAQVKELNESLEKHVQERTAELALAQQRLHESQISLASSEAKATLSTLVASVSHELGTPMGNGVMVASTLSDLVRNFRTSVEAGTLKRSELTGFLDTLTEGTAIIQNNLNRANTLLRDFRQVAADQASEQRRVFDLAGVVEEIIHSLTPSLKRHTHRIAMQIPKGIVMNSQPGPLGQVIINLINNAYLHAFEDRNEGVLTLDATLEGDWVHLRVQDNGVGIPAEHLSQLFDSFFSTKIGRGGTGLGMAIVENLVAETLGGRITVESTVGQGTRFDIYLPRDLPKAPASSQPADKGLSP